MKVSNSTLQTFVTTDASNNSLGATLSQVRGDGARQLVPAASRSLTDTEQKYAAIEKESRWAMEKFSQYVLRMRNIVIETNHKALTTLFGNKFLDRLIILALLFQLRNNRFHDTQLFIFIRNMWWPFCNLKNKMWPNQKGWAPMD